jgi:hypothetical protein
MNTSFLVRHPWVVLGPGAQWRRFSNLVCAAESVVESDAYCAIDPWGRVIDRAMCSILVSRWRSGIGDARSHGSVAVEVLEEYHRMMNQSSPASSHWAVLEPEDETQ